MTANPSGSIPSKERRVADRRQPALGTVCRLDAGGSGSTHLGLVWNLSTSGISMLMHTALEPGTELRGQLATMDENASLAVSARVIHLRKLHTGDYMIGAHFQTPLSTEEMRPFVGPSPIFWGRG